MRKIPLIVVGSGVAGLSVALSAAPRRVLLVTKGDVSCSGATPWAQGGIAASWASDDSPEQHARDTLVAGADFNNRVAVDFLTARAREAVDWLIEQGVQFDQTEAGPALCLEGGHSHHRILHAGGDSSGRVLADALTQRVLACDHIEILSHAELDGLMLKGGHPCGVSVRLVDGRVEVFEADDVVLATGGVGALFEWTSNPPECDGTGLALAMLAGAEFSDLEFVQFHPTALAPLAGAAYTRLPLISEAVRGAGGILVDASGRKLMSGVHPRRDLAPRDIVSRCVWRARQSGSETFLDARCLGDTWPERFPTIFAACAARGIDPRSELIPIVPAAHFHMGGITTDLDGRTSLPNLYAVGEVASNGVHGANRLASNSLLEGVVFGRRLGAMLKTQQRSTIGKDKPQHLLRSQSASTSERAFLRKLLWSSMGLERDAKTLVSALERMCASSGIASSCQSRLAAAMLTAALRRTGSIGAHFRSDDGRHEKQLVPA